MMTHIYIVKHKPEHFQAFFQTDSHKSATGHTEASAIGSLILAYKDDMNIIVHNVKHKE